MRPSSRRPIRLAGVTLAMLVGVAGTAAAAPPRPPPPAAVRPAPTPVHTAPTHAPPPTPSTVPAAIHLGAHPELPRPKPIVVTTRGAAVSHVIEEPTVALDRDAIRASNGHLSDDVFAKKWSAALASPLLFFRSFPSAYYKDLRSVVSRKVPGGTGVVLGDPHPENFGFIRTAGGTEFVFNDFDDSGRGPVAIDALRYFTAVRLAYQDKPHLFERVVDAYIDAVHDGTTHAPPSSVKPHWGDLRDDNAHRFTNGRHFRLEDDTRLSAPPPKVASTVTSLVQGDARFGDVRVLDVAIRERDYGGSGGLERIWVLAKRKGEEPRIIELKETTTPATSELGGKQMTSTERLPTLKQTFLKAPAEDDLFEVSLGGKRFLVRDRDRMASVALEDLSHDERDDLLRAQVSVMANVHRDGWSGVDAKEMRAWLTGSSELLAGRWQKAFDAAKKGR